MRFVALCLALFTLSGCYWPQLKKGVKKQFRSEVRTTKSFVPSLRDIWEEEFSVYPDLKKQTKREFRRDLRSHRGLWHDIKSLDCPP